MKILIIGSGGREHALAWKISQSPRVTEVLCAPGNAGTSALGTNVDIGAGDLEGLANFAAENEIDLTVVGPEDPLCRGLVDAFQKRGLPAFGPSAAAARLEGSKAWCKQFLQRHNVPTSSFGVFTEAADAEAYVNTRTVPQVVKADGLAAGKGVIVCDTSEEAKAAVREMLVDQRFGDAGASVVVEDRVDGEEASFMALCDGLRVVPLASSQDHKRALDGDRGPNTGGMGAYSPAPVVTEALAGRIMEEIMQPIARGMAAEGSLYRGVLYAGLMISGDTINVLEINCRFGDPETQPVLARLQSDLVDLMAASVTGSLAGVEPTWDPRATLCIVMASGGYPGSYGKGHPIQGIADAEAGNDVVVFHAGTTTDDQGNVQTAGGRVLGVTAYGDTIEQAQKNAYTAVKKISWPDAHYRTDIGDRAVNR
ncbi:MAG: phosphoribosylamine--glycine ligase [bacterium]